MRDDGAVWLRVRVSGLESEVLDDAVIEWTEIVGVEHGDRRVRRLCWMVARAIRQARREQEDGKREVGA